MPTKLALLLLVPLVAAPVRSAQSDDSLPDKLKKLQENYEGALARATAPITATYLKELEKMKSEFTKAGDLKSAVAADTLMKEAQATLAPASGEAAATLSAMNDRQFKKWLSSVVISEVGSPFGNQYTYVKDVVNSSKAGSAERRPHPLATIEVGKIVVPFTSTTAVIAIDNSMTSAEVTFTTGGKYKATITKKED